MTHQFEVYKCMHCGNIVEVVHGGGAPLVCCGENMKHMTEGTSDGAKEKHVPVLEKTASGWKVSVGSTAKATKNFSNPVKNLKPNFASMPPM